MLHVQRVQQLSATSTRAYRWRRHKKLNVFINYFKTQQFRQIKLRHAHFCTDPPIHFFSGCLERPQSASDVGTFRGARAEAQSPKGAVLGRGGPPTVLVHLGFFR